MMDSNINLLNFEPSSPSVKLIETALENGFIQTFNKAKRIFNKKVSLIDHIFTNSKNPIITSGSIVCDLSDHCLAFISPPPPPNQTAT